MIINISARYECYDSLEHIDTYQALQLEQSGDDTSARTLRPWSQHEEGIFAQPWVSAIGVKR